MTSRLKPQGRRHSLLTRLADAGGSLTTDAEGCLPSSLFLSLRGTGWVVMTRYPVYCRLADRAVVSRTRWHLTPKGYAAAGRSPPPPYDPDLWPLHSADPDCRHQIRTEWSGYKCVHCRGWYRL